jgi:hypothetical protein
MKRLLPICTRAPGVLLGLGTVAITLVRRKRERALDLILEGREYLPVAAVQHQRRRLVACVVS